MPNGLLFLYIENRLFRRFQDKLYIEYRGRFIPFFTWPVVVDLSIIISITLYPYSDAVFQLFEARHVQAML